jgi:trehalose synthase
MIENATSPDGLTLAPAVDRVTATVTQSSGEAPPEVMSAETPEANDVTFDEQFYPARPRTLRPSVRRARTIGGPTEDGLAEGSNPRYVEWLRGKSMLADANQLAMQLSGQGSMWQKPFAHPNPRSAVDRAAVWFTAYPLSLITAPGQSYLATLADPSLWATFAEIGIDAVHTGPVKQAGGLNGWNPTPSVDGHFDRVSMQIDPIFGTEDEFRQLCAAAAEVRAIVIDDIVPGHTGKGADFRLAELAVEDYPGIYHMIQIEPQDWHLLPDVRPGSDSINIGPEAESALEKAGYIIGQLQRVIFYEPGLKETNWSVTRAVTGADGVKRRWVYLHYFKAGQPSINWIDPSFAGMRLVIGDACHSIADLGSGALRLDANGFLGAEKSAEGGPAWSEGHPLSEASNHFIASLVRKIGGFTFQELNLAIDDIKITSESGADLSYDFVNRPAYHHALVTRNTEFLRLTLNLSLQYGVEPAALVHAMQNHDELTHELMHFSYRHSEDLFSYAGEELTGVDLGQRIRSELINGLTADPAGYNLPFTTNGIACTTVSVIAASLGMPDVWALSAADIETITRAHLLLAMFNALQPGVFAVSGWDLTGMTPLPTAEVASLIFEGDTRWINRGAHDLMGLNPGAERAEGGMPRSQSLYGPLPAQLADPRSFASGLRRIIGIRNQFSLATARQVDVPDVSHDAMLVMVHELEDGRLQITALNFSEHPISGTIRSEQLPSGARVWNGFTGDSLATVDNLGSFMVALEPFDGACLMVEVVPVEIVPVEPGGQAAE